MNTIRILPEMVASQIAAGEVVERPASVVRELLDNAIDAGANRIHVHIDRGGKALIRVSDDGKGMVRDDLLLSVERHATSKIFTAEDLDTIRTLGFRGEALPSIASVSRLEITSRPPDQLAGFRLRIDGGRLRSVDEVGSPPGAAVQVRDLFFNVPARRKFMRTVKTETDHIVETFTRIAMPYSRIHFKLTDRAKTLLNLPSTENEVNRLTALMGRQTVSSMVEAVHDRKGLRFRAHLGNPARNRSRGDHIYIYVNGRSVRDKTLVKAIMEGYGQRLMKGRYPEVVLFLEIDPGQVDVNVHPTKQEIRFRDASLVYKDLAGMIDACFGRKLREVFENPAAVRTLGKPERAEPFFAAEPPPAYPSDLPRDIPSQSPLFQEQPVPGKSPVQVIGQLKETYILCRAEDGLLIFDQHAAHERIVYETMKRSIHGEKIDCQTFLIPYKLELSLSESRVISEKREQLLSLGLELESFGGNTFLLRAVPAILTGVDWESFLRELIPLIEKEETFEADRVLDSLLTLMACHGAVRAGQRLAGSEMEQLISRLQEMELPTHCPHGRPIFVKFDDHALEKMFKRVV